MEKEPLISVIQITSPKDIKGYEENPNNMDWVRYPDNARKAIEEVADHFEKPMLVKTKPLESREVTSSDEFGKIEIRGVSREYRVIVGGSTDEKLVLAWHLVDLAADVPATFKAVQEQIVNSSKAPDSKHSLEMVVCPDPQALREKGDGQGAEDLQKEIAHLKEQGITVVTTIDNGKKITSPSVERLEAILQRIIGSEYNLAPALHRPVSNDGFVRK